ATATRAPACAKASAVARPIPLDAPVTRTTESRNGSSQDTLTSSGPRASAARRLSTRRATRSGDGCCAPGLARFRSLGRGGDWPFESWESSCSQACARGPRSSGACPASVALRAPPSPSYLTAPALDCAHAMIHDVEIKTTPLDDYAAVAHLSRSVAELRAHASALAPALGGRTVWMVNSTARGGGVAEMMPRVVGMLRELGVSTRWLVGGTTESEILPLTES